MKRQQWIAERRAAVAAEYDEMAASYDILTYPTTVQHEWVERLAALCPDGGRVLDAPCGTGLYFEVLAGAGLAVVGVDASAGMLEQARRRGIAEALHHLALQDLDFDAEFDAAITVDAMENVAPEDWSDVLRRLHDALRPGGHHYLTVEEVDEAVVDRAFEALRARGIPVVHGEVIEGDVAGYHYYPGRERVLGWVEGAGLELLDEAYHPEDGWGYRHLLLRRPPSTAPVDR
jgi:2-polyprenyl-3-methyl-5-hydroxy-6-metoxy-1,4-benzoquinol methylase